MLKIFTLHARNAKLKNILTFFGSKYFNIQRFLCKLKIHGRFQKNLKRNILQISSKYF